MNQNAYTSNKSDILSGIPWTPAEVCIHSFLQAKPLPESIRKSPK